MRKVSWIAKENNHYAVIVSDRRYINLVATKNDFFVRLIGTEGEEDIVYSSSTKNLNDAKRLAAAFGHSLLESPPETQGYESIYQFPEGRSTPTLTKITDKSH